MKFIFTLITFLSLSSLTFGQNNLFIPFGQTKAQVQRYLSSRDYVTKIVEDGEMQSLRANLDARKQVEYAFKNGKLYATTVSRNYVDKKLAKDIQKNVLEYMDYLSRGALKQSNKDGINVYTCVLDTRIIKLFVQQHSNSTTLTLTSISRKHMPEGEDAEIMYEMEILNKTFISN